MVTLTAPPAMRPIYRKVSVDSESDVVESVPGAEPPKTSDMYGAPDTALVR